MKRLAYGMCSLIAVALAISIIYLYGITLGTLAIALLLLCCPILLVWFTQRLARRSEDAVDAMVREASLRRGKE